MADYTKFPRGSEWRKWDLHVHTPFSYHNSFPEWDQYVIQLKEKAVEHDIEVVGITDYFSIEGYEKFLDECEDHERNDSPRIRLSNNKFLYLIPVIELRLDNFTDDNNSVNIHIAFSPEILPSTIKSSFLESLNIRYQDKKLKCKESDLIKIGDSIENSGYFNVNLNIENLQPQVKNSLIKKALSVITFSSSTFENQLHNFDKSLKDAGISKESYIIIIANKGHGGLSDFKWVGLNGNMSRAGNIRQNLLNMTDLCFSNNPEDKDFLLGRNSDTPINEILSRFRTLKPCIWGSDAHETRFLFHPSNGTTNDYTWIKADPTFEGLRQILFEPEDRVKIQAFKPDVKNDRHVISQFRFIDENASLFDNKPILLNENLNAIIGGKSSGKSLLLYSAAKSIDPDQVEKTSNRLGFEGYQFSSSYDFEVIWKNGTINTLNDTTDKHQKIIFIPQLYINYLVEKDNKEDLNKLVENILLQDSNFNSFYENVRVQILAETSEIENFLTNYLQIRTKALEIQQKSKDLGKSTDILKSIEEIQKSILEGQKLTNLTSEEFEIFNKLLQEKSVIEEKIRDQITKKSIIKEILNELNSTRIELFGSTSSLTQVILKGKIDRILDKLTNIPSDLVLIREKIETDYNQLIINLENEIEQLNLDTTIKSFEESLASNIDKLKPFNEKIAGQKELKKLSDALEKEKLKLQEAKNIEKQLENLLNDYNDLRQQTSVLLQQRYENYLNIVKHINDTKHEIGSGVSLSASVLYKQIDFPLFHQVNKAAISKEHYFNTLFDNGLLNYNKISELYSMFIRIKDDTLLCSPDINIPLKQNNSLEEILRGLIKDSFIIDYKVTYKGDELLSMSPGKKGTVLLILFLEISSSEYPILIDQPEDNLDNRTIYDLLCNMIKEKKKDRQIIIVSHNANLVVATDAENIIVANQEGQESIGIRSQFKFEYVNGSIEHSFPRDSNIKDVLFQQGIKEHACDVLEGGNEAFKQRERKYSIK